MKPNKYGHIKRTSPSVGQAWKWAVIAAVGLWALAVCVFNTGRIAALFGYHSALGEPVLTVAGYRCYWPWKLLEWASEFQRYEAVGRIVDQTYLMGVGVPLLLFIIYMASQQGLKGREGPMVTVLSIKSTWTSGLRNLKKTPISYSGLARARKLLRPSSCRSARK